MSTDAELLRRVMRWSLVKPEAVCGGSNAQAINVFTDALADIRRLADALEAARADGDNDGWFILDALSAGIDEKWHDEFRDWYVPSAWLGVHRAVVAFLERKFSAARAEEREACARVADAHCSDESAATPDGIWAATRIQARDQAAQQIAAAIRNRTPSPPAEEKKT